MDKQSADRIIVKSNARMKIVLDWFSKNREWLKQQEFHAHTGLKKTRVCASRKPFP